VDDADIAQRIEERQREQALTLHRERAQRQSEEESDVKTRNCIDCGDPISKARLAALPYAKRCVECQEYMEWRRH